MVKKIYTSQDEELKNVSQTSWCIFCTPLPHSFNTCDKYIVTPHSSEDKIKFWKTNWEFVFITGNSERELQLFSPENSKRAFLVSEKLHFGLYYSLRIFQEPPTNRRNQLKMTHACDLRLQHPAHVFPRVHELTFSTVKCLVLRAESAKNMITLNQLKQNGYGNGVYNTLSFTYVQCWFRYHI